MSLQGKLIKLDDGGFGFEYTAIHTRYSDPNDVIGKSAKPSKVTQVWKLSHWRIGGMGWASEESAIGKPATCRDSRVHVYLGNGISLDGELLGGGSAKSISLVEEPLPCPKVRKDIETRWNSSREQWEKLLRKGWVAA